MPVVIEGISDRCERSRGGKLLNQRVRKVEMPEHFQMTLNQGPDSYSDGYVLAAHCSNASKNLSG
jgi:hypothetical protein